MIFKIPPLSSGGIILSYQCTSQCRHCLYASAPGWKEWMSPQDIDRVLTGISRQNQFLTGIHFAGGEPFIQLKRLAYAVSKAVELNIPVDYVETNGFWAWNDEKAESVLRQLKEAGLRRILVSCSPFHMEFTPMDRVRTAIRVGRKVFGANNVLIYTRYFKDQLESVEGQRTYALEEYLDAVGRERASLEFASEYGLIPNGRAATQLAFLYEHHPASNFYGGSCASELASPHHVHIDLYGHYIAGLCAGISLGDGFNLDKLYQGTDFKNRPVLQKLTEGGVQALSAWARKEYGFEESEDGYIAKCHLCLDIRCFLMGVKDSFPELQPKAFYENLKG